MDGMPMSMPTGTVPSSATSTRQSTPSLMEPTSGAGMEGMSSMGSTAETNNDCKVSMLWNWETIDACFLSKSWQIKTRGAFAGLCIGIAFLVILLELLRRASKVYDRYLIRQHLKKTSALAATVVNGSSETAHGALIAKENAMTLASTIPFRPNIFQQAIRALLHTLHFALAYWIMLLAMYYNGYVIISIIIGAFVGFFTLQWESISPLGGIEGGNGIGRDGTGCHG
ncbi:Ctr-domain-containing protein [Annulohypoxylon maeteangense]|uniref:Ctr-domain-containing protein n=1 Tax=Annulohypoxylon maeteangense TaxID=1927788 RepID=UPI0020075DD1|nr:Ctr-domain-containing protein [Annulohypoxylon maeteangense]KAI0879815.1 Ctr-domain-containing protein [Annulohypoxylon maeteangense]